MDNGSGVWGVVEIVECVGRTQGTSGEGWEHRQRVCCVVAMIEHSGSGRVSGFGTDRAAEEHGSA